MVLLVSVKTLPQCTDVDALILSIFLSEVVNWMYVCAHNIFRLRILQFFLLNCDLKN